MQHGPQALAEIALDVAQKAAALVLRGWRTRPVVSEKARANLVTEYDLASEHFIRGALAERAPEVAIVAEEEGGTPGSGTIFYCDPLDGTTNFVHGHPFWCVSIGVVSAGVPIAGAVVAPSLQTEWVAWQGGPAHRNGVRCSVSMTNALAEALVATGFPSDRSRAPENNFQTFETVKRRVRAVRRCGAAAIDMCFVGDGTYDAYWERLVHPWDVAGGAAVVLSGGGKVSALDGGASPVERGNILASNGSLHEPMLALVR